MKYFAVVAILTIIEVLHVIISLKFKRTVIGSIQRAAISNYQIEGNTYCLLFESYKLRLFH